ncbi:MAG: endolytic transglycosylase MltG [Clostridia bacterium]|nr:endolytic transglycosylase MltG [Clostridia bacterium]
MLLIFGVVLGFIHYSTSAVGVDNHVIHVTIDNNSTTSQIASRLKDQGVIRSEYLFRIYTRLTKTDQGLKAGEYHFDGHWTIPQVVERLKEGTVKTLSFTIPEGYNVLQISRLLESEGVVDAGKFLHTFETGKFEFPYLGQNERNKYSLEGFLFPDTYKISPKTNEKEIIQMMLENFTRIYGPEYQHRAEELGLSVHEVVTLASIVEREAKIEKERPIIAAVFHNRLKKGMRLQSCATVQYALGEIKDELLYEDLDVQSPYNTYLNQGLPPGPICSPGEASIKAVLYPADVSYLYFVAKEDGHHAFSDTYEGHLSAKNNGGG